MFTSTTLHMTVYDCLQQLDNSDKLRLISPNLPKIVAFIVSTQITTIVDNFRRILKEGFS